MAATFRRKAEPGGAPLPTKALRGTKPWTGGITLVSTGLRELDQILGGGQPLGTCVYVDEDRWTQSLARCLIQYWCAEGICHEQRIVAPIAKERGGGDDMNDHDITVSSSQEESVHAMLGSLPLSLNIAKTCSVASESSNDGPPGPAALDALPEDESDEDRPGNDMLGSGENDLEIAWQYRQDVQRERLGGSAGMVGKKVLGTASARSLCHSFNLQDRLTSQIDIYQHLFFPMIDIDAARHSSRDCAQYFFQRVLEHLRNILGSDVGQVVRLLFYRQEADILSFALPLLLAYIRDHELPVVVAILMNSTSASDNGQVSPHLLNVQRCSDVVLSTESFAARRVYPPPAEYRDLHGLLRVCKVNTWTAATAHGGGGGHYADVAMSRRPVAFLYGLKRDRRKLHIQLLHIPPEEYAEGGGSGSGGVRSGAGKVKQGTTGPGCTSSAAALDF